MSKLSMSPPRAILAAQLALLIVCVSVVTPAMSHGYMSIPRARNVLARDRSEGNANAPVNYCPHCLNLGGRRTSDLVYPETLESGRSHGLCGDAPSGSPDSCWLGGDCPEQDHMPGGRFYTSDGVGGAIQETYISGSTIEAEFFITAHHRGFIELRLCDEARVTQECLLKYEPLERVRFEDDYTYSAQPIDPNYPGRFILNPVCAFPQEGDRTYSGYRMKGQFKLPEGVTCDHCVIQMWWVTANSCVPPDYEEFSFPSEWASCGGDGGSGFYNPGGAPCLGSTRAEEFWNCADVRVTSDDGTIPTQSPGAPTEAPAPTTTPPTTSPTTQPTTQPPTCNAEIPLWGKCGGNDGGPWDDKCCAPGSWCRFQDEWYSQCVEGTGPTPSPPQATPSPTPFPTTKSPSPTPSPTTQSPNPTPEPTTATPSPSPTSRPSPTPSATEPETTCSKIVPTWSQCAGPDVDGENVCCASGDICVYQNSYYSQCRPDMDAVEPPAPGGACDKQIQTWGKCGGRDRDYEGTCCQAADECVFSDIYYSQCKPKPYPTRKMLGLH